MNSPARTLRTAFKMDLLIISGAFSLFLIFNLCSDSFLLIPCDFIFFVFDLLPIVPSAVTLFLMLFGLQYSSLGKTYKKAP